MTTITQPTDEQLKEAREYLRHHWEYEPGDSMDCDSVEYIVACFQRRANKYERLITEFVTMSDAFRCVDRLIEALPPEPEGCGK